MSNITHDEASLGLWTASISVASAPPAHLTHRHVKAIEAATKTARGADRVSVSNQARTLRAVADVGPARTQKATHTGAHVSIERLARIKQAYEARRIRPNPQLIASHLLEERRWL